MLIVEEDFYENWKFEGLFICGIPLIACFGFDSFRNNN